MQVIAQLIFSFAKKKKKSRDHAEQAIFQLQFSDPIGVGSRSQSATGLSLVPHLQLFHFRPLVSLIWPIISTHRSSWLGSQVFQLVKQLRILEKKKKSIELDKRSNLFTVRIFSYLCGCLKFVCSFFLSSLPEICVHIIPCEAEGI